MALIGAAAADGDLTQGLAVRKDTVAVIAGTADGDYHPLVVDAAGRLYVHPGVAASHAPSVGITADVNAAVAAAAGLRLMGVSVRESAVTPAVATVIIVHGATAAATAFLPIELAANGSLSLWYGPGGIAVPNGLSIDVVAGTLDVHLFYATLA